MKTDSCCKLPCTQLRKSTSIENFWFPFTYVAGSIKYVFKKKCLSWYKLAITYLKPGFENICKFRIDRRVVIKYMYENSQSILNAETPDSQDINCNLMLCFVILLPLFLDMRRLGYGIFCQEKYCYSK